MPSKAEPSSKAALSRCVARAPPALIHRLQKLAAGGEPTKGPSGAFKRKVSEILQPAKDCYIQLSLDGDNGDPVFFWAAHVERLLGHIVNNCSAYKKALRSAGQTLSFYMYADASTAGNVLKTSQSLKGMLWYVAIEEIGYLLSPHAWIPFAMIPQMDLDKISGGFSALAARLSQHFSQWVSKELQVLDQKFEVVFKAFVGDYEAVAALLAGKGASALKPCVLCMNCLSKTSTATKQDNYFQSISCWQFEKFQTYKQCELNQMYEEHLAKVPTMKKMQLEETERCLGFRLHKCAVLAVPEARNMFRLDKLLLDSMHIYFSNGIAAQELLLLQQSLYKRHGITLDFLKERFLEVSWLCQSEKYKNPSARRRLFHESFWSGNCYKGEATAVWFVLPLVCFYTSALATYESLPELESFHALLKVVRELKKFRHSHGNTAALATAQREHLKLFAKVYGEGEVRPKHYLALHLSAIYERCYCDCWAGEAKHKLYKQHLASDLGSFLTGEQDGKFASLILTRLLHMHIEFLRDWTPALTGTIFEPHEVQESAGIHARVSKSYKRDACQLNQNDVVFWHNDLAGWVEFFVEQDNTFFLFYHCLEEQETSMVNARLFKRHGLNAIQMDNLKDLRQPTWWSTEGDEVLCLL